MAIARLSELDATFAALADPTRRAILQRLWAGEASVAEVASPFRISGPAISRHLRVLEEAGLIARRRQGQQLICRLVPTPLVATHQWLGFFSQFNTVEQPNQTDGQTPTKSPAKSVGKRTK